MNVASGPRRNAAAAAMSAEVPTRPVPEASIIPRIRPPLSPESSALPMGVEITPGLIELIRAPRAPQARLAGYMRSWFARLATL